MEAASSVEKLKEMVVGEIDERIDESDLLIGRVWVIITVISGVEWSRDQLFQKG